MKEKFRWIPARHWAARSSSSRGPVTCPEVRRQSRRRVLPNSNNWATLGKQTSGLRQDRMQSLNRFLLSSMIRFVVTPVSPRKRVFFAPVFSFPSFRNIFENFHRTPELSVQPPVNISACLEAVPETEGAHPAGSASFSIL